MMKFVMVTWAAAIVVLVLAFSMDSGSERAAKAAAAHFAPIGNPDSVKFRGVHKTQSSDLVCGEIVFQEKTGGWSGWQPFRVDSGVMMLMKDASDATTGACSKA